MALKPGTLLGPHEIISLIGQGGMGEVYKARDTRLDRIVAIKTLPAHLAERPDLRERFKREASTLANLKHAHICVLYDIGHQDGIDYLVMEYLEGETLSQRLQKGAVPLEQVLQYATEISDALDKAHRAGFTHRDIKPGNIMLVPQSGSGSKTSTKLLDFGLAKLKQEVAKAITPLSEMPTAPGVLTQHGTLLGTLQYMAPEQVEGKTDELDGRTDVFAFGAVVYEMATGKKAFDGRNQSSVIAKILEVDPPPMSSLKPPGKLSPPALDRIVKQCLAKDPDERWQTAADLWRELQWIAGSGSQVGLPAPPATRRKLRERITQVAAAVLFISTLGLGLLQFRETLPEARPARFFVLPPEKTTFAASPMFLTVSPDGTRLAFVGTGASGVNPQLWVRPVDSLAAQLLPGTEGADQPFWSADSRFLAFFAQGKLKKIDVTGGLPQALGDVSPGGSGTWSREGVILFTQGSGLRSLIYRVSAAGGAATAITAWDASRGERAHLWPYFLPDGKHFLYFARSSNAENNAVYVASLDSNERKLLLNANSNVAYVSPGYLLFHREGTLMAQSFDAARLELTGESFPVAEGVRFSAINGRAAFSASENGVLAYRTGSVANEQLTWFARDGKKLGPVGEAGSYRNIALSPDEKRVAVQRLVPGTGTSDIWLLELSRGIFTRFTFDPSTEGNPIWSPDGRQIVLDATRKGKPGLYRKDLSGSGTEELLFESEEQKHPEDWSPDGQFIVYGWTVPTTKFSLLPLSGDRKPKLLLESPFRKDEPHVSPDGRWLAYSSEESGRPEIYVQPFQGPGEKLRISANGGGQPRWRKDGKELFYLALDGTMMAVPIIPIRGGATLEAGAPKELFQTGLNVNPTIDQFAVTGDGQRFLLDLPLSEESATPISVVLNWTAELRRSRRRLRR